jgi:putative DNA-invertase from lambdoid prophage Rac
MNISGTGINVFVGAGSEVTNAVNDVKRAIQLLESKEKSNETEIVFTRSDLDQLRKAFKDLDERTAGMVKLADGRTRYLSTLGVFSDAIIALLSALAKQERLRIGERTKAGLERAKANGKRLGRPRTSPDRIAEAKKLRASHLSFTEIGQRLGVSRVRAFQLVNQQ